MKKSYLMILLLILPIQSDATALTERTLPWGMSEDKYIEMNDNPNINKEKDSLIINGLHFSTTTQFSSSKGLIQIFYSADLKQEPYLAKCKTTQTAINKIYGQSTNDVQVTNQNDNNYNEVIWTSKIDRIVRLFCYEANNHNYVTVTIFPRWQILDCTLHDSGSNKKKKINKKAFFYFDKINKTIRFFNDSYVTLPFESTFNPPRIEFIHNNASDRTTIDLNTGVIMSKFIDNDGKEHLLVGKCKKQ